MANTEHLRILEGGAKNWNTWREKNNSIADNLFRANLSHFSLSGINLSKIDLTCAKFYEADLSHADLSETKISFSEFSGGNFSNANLSNANLIGANLSNGIFEGANLSGANLTNANLTNADFSNAIFIGSNLTNANLYKTKFSYINLSFANLTKAVFLKTYLDGTNFKECYLNHTIFAATNLVATLNLETVRVGNECTIDFQTLRNSKNIPSTFLQKIGLPENYINYLPDFYDDTPLRLYPVFLSHSWNDKRFAYKLYEAMTSRNVLVWYDERKMKPGDDIREEINKAIDLYDKLIIVCSKNSLVKSWWVDKELNRALDKEQRLFKEKGKQINTIIPITIDDYVYNEWEGEKRSDIHRYLIGDFRGWEDEAKFEKALNNLMEALNADRLEDRPPSFL